MASPRYKIYSSSGQLMATAVDPVIAATVVANYGTGATVKDGWNGRVVVYRHNEEGDWFVDDIAVEIVRTSIGKRVEREERRRLRRGV